MLDLGSTGLEPVKCIGYEPSPLPIEVTPYIKLDVPPT